MNYVLQEIVKANSPEAIAEEMRVNPSANQQGFMSFVTVPFSPQLPLDVRRADVLSRIGIISLIERKVASYLPNCLCSFTLVLMCVRM